MQTFTFSVTPSNWVMIFDEQGQPVDTCPMHGFPEPIDAAECLAEFNHGVLVSQLQTA